ncbi:MAG: TonB-dependent receptor, partial [Bryobacteraceae bacterium]|nr:TonB-dependent receptor [Bryobacteraceae bacterium]
LYNLPDFLFGAQSAYSLSNQIVLNYRQRMHFAYLQDDWKVNSKLAVNLGVRYEFATPQYEAQNRISSFDPVANKLIQAKDGSLYDRSLVNPDRNNWAPRVGLAYQVTDKTVVRSGYGISYIHFNRLGGENLLGYNGPNIVNLTINQTPALPACTGNNYQNCFRLIQQGFPEGLVNPSNFSTATTRTNYTPSDYKTSYVQSWHLTVQRELAHNLVLDVAYVGNRSNGLMILADYNQARPNNIGENLSLLARRPIQGFSDIQISYGGGFAAYHAMQVKLEKRYSAGIYLLNSFTWSKALDNASGHLETANGDNSRVNYRNLPGEKAIGGYDQPFNNTSTILLELPYGRGRRWGSSTPGVVNVLLGGWRITGINTMTSGQPVNVNYTVPAAQQASSYPTYRPDYIGGSIYPATQTPTTWLNRAAFAVPATNILFGSAGRNIARTESIYNFDFGLHKEFPLFREDWKLQFRSEFFNLFNTTNLGSPATNISNANFGQITGLASPARQIQFALKLVF